MVAATACNLSSAGSPAPAAPATPAGLHPALTRPRPPIPERAASGKQGSTRHKAKMPQSRSRHARTPTRNPKKTELES